MPLRDYLPDTDHFTLDDCSQFVERYREKLKNLFSQRADLDEIGSKRGVPPYVLKEVRSCSPLSSFIPRQHGGRGGSVSECLSVLEASSYHSLPLGLMMGINGALFLQPVAKYGNAEVKDEIFDQFLSHNSMGGLMITEPDYGTDALNMQTKYRSDDDGFHISGIKHWAGLTGWADYWLVTARRANGSDSLSRDIDFFICESNSGGIQVEETFQNLGLYMLPYGRNRIDIHVPQTHRLEPESTGIKMMLDILHRSRLQFSGLAMGFLRRMFDEAIEHCKERIVGGQPLFEYDQVKKRLSRLQAACTACSAMCMFTSERASTENNVADEMVSANAIKTVVTDMMHESAQSLMQLVGAKGYRLDHIAGRSLVDSRPFQIFEGSNDVLYKQVSEAVLKMMRTENETNLQSFLDGYELTSHVSDYLDQYLDFQVDPDLPQRKMVQLGEILSRVISMDFVLELGDRGFQSDLIASCLSSFQEEIEGRLGAFHSQVSASVVENYEETSSWRNFAAG